MFSRIDQFRPDLMHALACFAVTALYYTKLHLLYQQFIDFFAIKRCWDVEPCVRTDIDLWTRVMTEVIFSLVLKGNHVADFEKLQNLRQNLKFALVLTNNNSDESTPSTLTGAVWLLSNFSTAGVPATAACPTSAGSLLA
jgi:hypothetical protein